MNTKKQETLFWKRFVNLCSQVGRSPNAVCKDLGLSSATATHWKNGSIPNDIAKNAIANYFNVPVEILTNDEPFEITTKPDPVKGTKMFKQKFIKLCSQKGESPSFVCSKIGISPAAFSQWTDETIPRKVTQQRIADYFGVSVDYLLGKEQEKKTSAKVLTPAVSLSPRETAVIIAYRTHPTEQPAVDKLLDVPTTPEEITLYVAAYSTENTPDTFTTVPKSEWEALKSIPPTKKDLK